MLPNLGRHIRLYDDPIIGKPTGNDLREGKITLPLLYALEKTDVPEHKEMIALAQKEMLSTEEISTLIDFAKREGGIEYAYDKMQQLRDKACSILDKYPQNDAITSFKNIFDYIISRKL